MQLLQELRRQLWQRDANVRVHQLGQLHQLGLSASGDHLLILDDADGRRSHALRNIGVVRVGLRRHSSDTRS